MYSDPSFSRQRLFSVLHIQHIFFLSFVLIMAFPYIKKYILLVECPEIPIASLRASAYIKWDGLLLLVKKLGLIQLQNHITYKRVLCLSNLSLALNIYFA